MSDQCKSCTIRGDFKKCLSEPCFHHENWAFMEMQQERDSYKAKAEGLYKLIQEALHVDVYVEEEAKKIMEGVI